MSEVARILGEWAEWHGGWNFMIFWCTLPYAEIHKTSDGKLEVVSFI